MSHRDLVSIIPFSSVSTSTEPDDRITAMQDGRRPLVAAGNRRASSPDQRDAVRQLVGCLDRWAEPGDSELLSLADDEGHSSPGSSGVNIHESCMPSPA